MIEKPKLSKEEIERRRRAKTPTENPLKMQRRIKALTQQIREQEEEIEEYAKANAELFELATKDDLTGLLTRKPFDAGVRQNVQLLRHSHKFDRVAFLLIDVDNFKEFNTLYQHTGGDAVLKSIGTILTEEALRRGGVDFVCRWGGDEFTAAFLAGGDQEAELIADNIRRLVAEKAAQIAGLPEGVQITVSIGIVEIRDNVDTEILHQQVSKALKESKDKGKNRFVNLGLLRGESGEKEAE